MTTTPFAISRADGRSNAQVVLDYVKDGEPGRIYPFAELSEALRVGTIREYPVSAVRAIVAGVCERLSKEQQRALHSIRGVGYRLALAIEHRGLALSRRRRANVQQRREVQLLENVKWAEMDEQSRKIHEATLVLVVGLYQNQRALNRRLTAVEDAIRGLTKTEPPASDPA